MDRDQLARRLYVERVSALLGDNEIDEELINQLWKSKASPVDAAKMIISVEEEHFHGPSWLSRYLNRNK